ncbi:hypothetical protein MYK68_18620 [Gordonia sp. PP30]|uniref:hypothetical protein n=1 Tax=Gordonia sp. PP30 TaxID=2935861 RepID=UPI001FFE6BD8|nr:hypothetical protein [Gordonia sp. PP30]UQE74699.1 hypothetical protein MYK68_18620 [Gordonia sp. PP30]
MTDQFDPHNPPSEFYVVDDQGMPLAHVDLDRLQADATVLMYDMASTAGDDASTDAVAAHWSGKHDPDYFGYLCAAALSLMTRCVLASTLDAVAASGVDLRPILRASAADARRDLGRRS